MGKQFFYIGAGIGLALTGCGAGYVCYQHGNSIKNSTESELEIKCGNKYLKSKGKK